MNCEVCGEPLEGKREGTKTCSPKCKQSAYRQRRNAVTLRKKCNECELTEACPPIAQKGSFKCMEIQKAAKLTVTPNRNATVTPEPQETNTITPGTNHTTIQNDRAHRFFYICNYIGSIEGTPTKKNGTYKLTYKDFKKLLPIINSRLHLHDESRWNKQAISRAKLKGPSISILFTKKNKTMALGIEHFSWESIIIPDMGLNISAKEAMDADAEIMMAEIENHFNEGIELDKDKLILDNLHTPKIRRLEGHFERPDKSVEELRKKGITNYRGKTTYNPAHFTKSHPGKIQTEREVDRERDKDYMDFFGNPIIEDKEDRCRVPYEGLNLGRYLTASIVIQNRTQEQIEQYAENLKEHREFVIEAKENVAEAKETNRANREFVDEAIKTMKSFNLELKATKRVSTFLHEATKKDKTR